MRSNSLNPLTAGLVAALAVGHVALAGGVAFENRTAEAGIFGGHHTAGALYNTSVTRQFGGGGVVADFNNDGWQDIYVLGGGGEPDRLFINQQDGTFDEQAAAWGVGDSHMGIAACAGDFNNDGWIDLYVTSLGPANVTATIGKHRLYRNNGDGTFTDVASAAGVNQVSSIYPDGLGCAFGDYDLDGDLDLFVTGWFTFGGQNQLFRNNGDGTFTNVTGPMTQQSPLLPLDSMNGFTPRFVDMNGDRYPELLLSSDFGTSRYFVNQGGALFVDTTTSSGLGLDGNGMGQAVGDLTGDGTFEWYVTSVHSEFAGTGDVPGTGNMCYFNMGDHVYLEDSVLSGVNDGGWGWGTFVADLDHDMDLDIVETNGWPDVNPFNVEEWLLDPPYVYVNDGAGSFTRLPDGTINQPGQGRGLASIDYDNDGDIDVVNFENKGPVTLWANLSIENGDPATTHWLRVFLDTSNAPGVAPQGIGSKVLVDAGGVSQIRSIDSQTSFVSQSERSAHFGLGAASIVATLTVQWPDGETTVLMNVPANQTITIAYGAANPADLNGDGVVDGADLAALLANWGGSGPADLDGSGTVDGADLAALLANWS